ncbi:MAG: hypothetical protein HAW67_00045 [Endozoicomonadaceae bacterium]|nr:hypothetical protein [Endozoicomonadaceae bacterium]
MENPIQTELVQLNLAKTELASQLDAIKEKKPYERVLKAIAEQRWYYFSNEDKSNVIFDRDTGYLWATKATKVPDNLDGEEFFEHIKAINHAGIKSWQLPCGDVFKYICKTDFPFKSGSGSSFGFFNQNRFICIKSESILDVVSTSYRNCDFQGYEIGLSDSVTRYDTDIFYYLFCSTYSLSEYSLPSNFDQFTDKQKEQAKKELAEQQQEDALKVFIKNNLSPVITDDKAAEAFKVITKKLLPLDHELKAVEDKINSLEDTLAKQTQLLSVQFDYRELLTLPEFSSADVDSSVIKFAETTINWCDVLQEKASEFEIRNHLLVAKTNEITLALSSKYRASSSLSDEENTILSNRQKFMLERLSMNFGTVRANLGLMKHQAQALKRNLFETNCAPDSLFKLAEIEAAPRPSFALMAENSSTMLIDVLKKIDIYESDSSYFDKLLNKERDWRKDFQSYKLNAEVELKNLAQENDIDEELWKGWLTEWTQKRFKIERCLEPLLSNAFEQAFLEFTGDFSQPIVIEVIELLESYKQKVDNFYLTERLAIYQKHAFSSMSSVQDKLEAETELYKLTLNFQKKLNDVIFSLANTSERLFLFHWIDEVADMSVDSVINFIYDNSLDSISKVVIEEFAQLRLQNYSTFINDAEAFAEQTKRWDHDFNKLMFKMRKELSQGNKE